MANPLARVASAVSRTSCRECVLSVATFSRGTDGMASMLTGVRNTRA